MPEYYRTLHDRKVVETSRSPAALLKKPNRFTAIFAALIAVAVLLVVGVVLLIRKLVRRLTGKRRKKHC